MMKRFLRLMPLTLTVLLLAGCVPSHLEAPPDGTPSSPADSSAADPSAAQTAPASSAPAQTGASSAPESDGTEHSLHGVVTDAAMHTLRLTDGNGATYTIPTDGVPIEVPSDGLQIGDEATVYYTGTLDPQAGAQGATILRIVVVAGSRTEQTVQELLGNMSTAEKCGQLFFIRCPEADELADTIRQYQPGGLLLFARDFQGKTVEQVQKTLQASQDASSTPLLIGTDEEGGTVNRISKYKQFRAVPFWSPRDLFREGGMELIKSDTEEKCRLLAKLGLNVNFAPVCDVCTESGKFIYPRAFGQDAQGTSDYVKTVVGAMSDNLIGAVLKHFPGYGDNADTHTGSALDTRSLETFESSDFLPFKAGIEAGAGAVLVSHNTVTSMDPDAPASLSENVHRILRDELGFDGVILTDDLSMDAVTAYTGSGEAAVRAVLAGNDMLLSSDLATQYAAVTKAVENGTISEAVLDAAVTRVLRWKLSLGLLD